MISTIGCHLSISNGYKKMLNIAKSINANAIQFFTRNPYSLNIKKMSFEDKEFIKNCNSEYNAFLIHAPYIINLCSKKENILSSSKNVIIEDLKYAESYFPINKTMYNIHPGNHVGHGIKSGIINASNAINEILSNDIKIKILLETMSGKGTEIGTNFLELAEIIDLIDNKKKIGICLDTCHIYSSGYDIVNNPDEVLDEFNKYISLKKLNAIHLNDSSTPMKSKKDRHEKIGNGYIGASGLINFVKTIKKKNIPIILETPNTIDGFKKEINFLISEINK